MTIEERKKVLSICSRILAVKDQLQELGHIPNMVVASTAKQPNRTNKKKIKMAKKKWSSISSGARHAGGVGMYGLGARIKIWR